MDGRGHQLNETRYFVEKYGDKGLTGFEERATPLMKRFDLVGKSYESRDVFSYFWSARMAIDQPMQCHSNDFSPINTAPWPTNGRRSITCATASAPSGLTGACSLLRCLESTRT